VERREIKSLDLRSGSHMGKKTRGELVHKGFVGRETGQGLDFGRMLEAWS
jgi:hypothetical protein